MNPFLASLSIKPVVKHTKWSLNKGTGEPSYIDSFVIPEYFDANQGSWYSGMDFSRIHEYSTGALQVFGYILSRLKWNQDYIELKPVPEFDPDKPYALVMKKSSFYNAVKELSTRAIIANRPKRVSTYWINPAMFFRGSRLKAFPEYVEGFLKPEIDTGPDLEL